MEVGDIVLTPNYAGVITRKVIARDTQELWCGVNEADFWPERELSPPVHRYVYKLGISRTRKDSSGEVDVEYRYFFKWPGIFVPGVRKEAWHPIGVVLKTTVSNDKMEDEP